MLREAERKDKAHSNQHANLKETSLCQVTPADTVRQISTNATRTRATMVPASMVWHHSAASVNLDTQADSVRPTSMSA